MKELELNVVGMMCTGCENRIKNVLNEIKGIKSVDANHKTGKVKIMYENDIDLNKIKDSIKELDFKIEEK